MADAHIGLPSRIEPGLTLISSSHERDGVHVVLDVHPLIRANRRKRPNVVIMPPGSAIHHDEYCRWPEGHDGPCEFRADNPADRVSDIVKLWDGQGYAGSMRDAADRWYG
jgi:hypothetical protein